MSPAPATAVARTATARGRDGAVVTGRWMLAAAAFLGRSAGAAGSRSRSAARAYAPPAWRGLVRAARWLAREGCAASVRAWTRLRPELRRAWLAIRAALARAGREARALTQLASEHLLAYVDARTRR